MADRGVDDYYRARRNLRYATNAATAIYRGAQVAGASAAAQGLSSLYSGAKYLYENMPQFRRRTFGPRRGAVWQRLRSQRYAAVRRGVRVRRALALRRMRRRGTRRSTARRFPTYRPTFASGAKISVKKRENLGFAITNTTRGETANLNQKYISTNVDGFAQTSMIVFNNVNKQWTRGTIMFSMNQMPQWNDYKELYKMCRPRAIYLTIVVPTRMIRTYPHATSTTYATAETGTHVYDAQYNETTLNDQKYQNPFMTRPCMYVRWPSSYQNTAGTEAAENVSDWLSQRGIRKYYLDTGKNITLKIRPQATWFQTLSEGFSQDGNFAMARKIDCSKRFWPLEISVTSTQQVAFQNVSLRGPELVFDWGKPCEAGSGGWEVNSIAKEMRAQWSWKVDFMNPIDRDA